MALGLSPGLRHEATFYLGISCLDVFLMRIAVQGDNAILQEIAPDFFLCA